MTTPPVENPTIWTLAGDWLGDLMAQQVPGSVVLLLALVGVAPWIALAVRSIWRRWRQ